MPKKTETGYIKYISQEEFDLLISNLKRWELNYRLIFYIMYYMGLRISEVLRLRYSDIIGDFARLRFKVAKGGNIIERVIPDKVKAELEVYLFVQKLFRTNNYLFEPKKNSGSRNPHLQVGSVHWRLKQLREEAGLADAYFIRKDGRKLARISPHTLRHAFITNFYAKSGHDLILTQRVIRHRKPETTARYIFTPYELEKEIVNKI